MGHEMQSVVGFGEKHLDCGMEKPSKRENQTNTSAELGTCCENTTQHLQVDDDFQLSSLDHSLDLPFVYALLQTFVFGANFFSSPAGAIPHYSPPPPPQDLQLLYETFLI